ncbi:MAG TPA: hypothetical protein PK328_12190 [Chitinophagaceae bacterium]|nr:hypothetical protein [Chitinophagaceae bacterium]
MKVIFLSIGLLAVTSVAGQQKETIDLDELIRYRYDSSLHKMKWSSEFLQKQLNPAPNPNTQPESKDLKGQLDYQLPNGDLVFRLPTDRMPCVKPGNQLLYTMPVLPYKKEQIQPEKPGSIPNPAL